MDEQGFHLALTAHRNQLEKKLWKLKGDPDMERKKKHVMARYDSIREKIIKDQYNIEAYVEQQHFRGTSEEKQ